MRTDGYYNADEYLTTNEEWTWGQGSKTLQLNIKLTADDMTAINEINQQVFEKEITNSTLGRILIRKGIQFFKNLK